MPKDARRKRPARPRKSAPPLSADPPGQEAPAPTPSPADPAGQAQQRPSAAPGTDDETERRERIVMTAGAAILDEKNPDVVERVRALERRALDSGMPFARFDLELLRAARPLSLPIIATEPQEDPHLAEIAADLQTLPDTWKELADEDRPATSDDRLKLTELCNFGLIELRIAYEIGSLTDPRRVTFQAEVCGDYDSKLRNRINQIGLQIWPVGQPYTARGVTEAVRVTAHGEEAAVAYLAGLGGPLLAFGRDEALAPGMVHIDGLTLHAPEAAAGPAATTAASAEPNSGPTAAPPAVANTKGCAPRDRWFHDLYHGPQTETNHSPAEICRKWNGLTPDERKTICPDSPGIVTRDTVVQAIKRRTGKPIPDAASAAVRSEAGTRKKR